jgi:glycosyltransferase involved in cell wall biosynthesis
LISDIAPGGKKDRTGMRIGFQAGAINERGMSVALYDYALGAQNVLGHEAVVLYSEALSNPDVVEKFKKSLKLIPVPEGVDGRTASEPHQLDFCYFIRDGRERRLDVAANRKGVHAVFRHFEPHGDIYAYVSDWLADWMTGGLAPAVPHIVDLPKAEGTLRQELNIPDDAFVVGRYGGFDQFNIPFVHGAVAEALGKRSNLYFLFVNTEKFIDHPRALFLPPIVRQEEKARFITSCDVGLNAKKIGESFGLAVAEFLMFGKPVFSWAGGMDQNHVAMSPKPEWIYQTRRDLLELLADYEPTEHDAELSRRSVDQYRPQAVMKRFDDVFLSGTYSTEGLTLTKSFKTKRFLQEKAMRAKFRLWKSL